jgi:hypothetical protein
MAALLEDLLREPGSQWILQAVLGATLISYRPVSTSVGMVSVGSTGHISYFAKSAFKASFTDRV